MQVEFNIYSCHLTSMTLIVAAGFYDHKMLHNASRGITARMLGVQVAERRKLAADLHDSVSQEFAAGLMHLRTGVMQIPDAGKNTSIRLAEQALSKGLQDLRHMAVGLRPELLEHSAFADVIEAYCETIEARYNIDVLFVDDIAKGVPRLSLEKREHLFRIVQESLGNAVTHGKAKTITVTIASKEKRKLFTLTIEDDGEGFDQSVDLDMSDRPHLGLRLMQERALVISGQFLITSRRGRGTTVSVSVPFDDAADTGVVGRDA